MPSSGLPAKPKPAQIVPPPLPRSRHTTEIAPTQPHRHAPLLHVSNPPPPSPPPPPCKLPSSMSSDSHPSYPSTHITQSPFRQTHTHLARSTPTRSSRRRPSLVPISLFPDLAAAVLRWYRSLSFLIYLSLFLPPLTEYIMYILWINDFILIFGCV